MSIDSIEDAASVSRAMRLPPQNMRSQATDTQHVVSVSFRPDPTPGILALTDSLL